MLFAAILVAQGECTRFITRIMWTALAIGSCTVSWVSSSTLRGRPELFSGNTGLGVVILCAAFALMVQILRWFPIVSTACAADRCRECGYDLTGNVSGICPECGAQVAHKMARSDEPERDQSE